MARQGDRPAGVHNPIGSLAQPSPRYGLAAYLRRLAFLSRSNIATPRPAVAVLPIAGARLGDIFGDIFGRRQLFLVGSAGLTLFSATSTAAPTIGLIACRALQGAFGALTIPQGLGLMKQVFTDDAELDKALSLFGPATGGGSPAATPPTMAASTTTDPAHTKRNLEPHEQCLERPR